MGKTSSAVKNRWNAAHYDRIMIQLPKGMKDDFKAACEANGTSMNAVVREAVEDYLEAHSSEM